MNLLTAVSAFVLGIGFFSTAPDAPKPSTGQSPSAPISTASKTAKGTENKAADCRLLAWNAKPASAAGAQNGASQLDGVLNSMDKAAASFKTVEAKFEWDQYTKLVDETDVQQGTIFYRRLDNASVEMGAHIEKPDTKIVVFSDGKIRIYQPKIDIIQEYPAGKNREAFESFLVLGFGGRGHDLAKSFDVQYDGSESVGGVNAARLVLLPKDPTVKKMFDRILLWIDPARGISVQQQLFQPSGDYRLAKYSDIKLNQRLPDDAFKIKTTHKTKVITNNG